MAKTQLEDIAARLRNARINRKLTQMEVFRLTQINNKTLSAYETAKTEPDLVSLSRLADLYKVSTDWIITGFEFKGTGRSEDAEAEIGLLKDKLKAREQIIRGIRELVSE
ncbi:helix-turn-helix domain-containing protein [Paenibacillus sp. Y412MC10]|uniref:helix-turn-helix domain-containing protein n=1 Tax=Geobacillus sp. (strain Y412MC10) TaxID=481743 RepID=UPI0011A53632|nr:helix-turn-helix transcriptional regulator [Paenibacillus sp. Y412MC10]